MIKQVTNWRSIKITISDFYAKFYKSDFLQKIEKWAIKEWTDIEGDKRIQPKQKAQKLKERLENNSKIFHEIVSEYLGGNEAYSPIAYAKAQKILQNAILSNTKNMQSCICSQLQDWRDRKKISGLDLSNNPKYAYTRLVHPSPEEWFHFPKELTALSNIFTPASLQFAGVSHFIQITFTLKKPYISLDDDHFYIIDNPVVKDTVLKMPIVRPTTLKGALRYAAMKTRIIESDLNNSNYFVNERITLVKLFGSEKEATETFLDNEFICKLGQTEGKKAVETFKERIKRCVSESGNREGRLIFYPVFFDSVGLDVIAPHDRKTRTVTRLGHILFETVPAGSCGTFSLLYFPFDLLPALRNEDKSDKTRAIVEMKEDLEILKEAVPAMLLTYGFAAKKTSGYGVVQDLIDFRTDSIDMKKANFDDYKNQINLLIKMLASTQ